MNLELLSRKSSEEMYMLEKEFREFLENIGLTKNGVASRMSRANIAEEILGYSLDEAVSTDNRMYDSLIKIQPYEDSKHNPIQNAIRKYYIFKNGNSFPQLRCFKR